MPHYSSLWRLFVDLDMAYYDFYDAMIIEQVTLLYLSNIFGSKVNSYTGGLFLVYLERYGVKCVCKLI